MNIAIRVDAYGTLLTAAAGLRDRNESVFLCIGGGASMDELRAEAEARGLGNMIFLPYQPAERLGESLAVPDVHLVVLRPQTEGLIVPSKFYGSAAAGRPTIFVGSLEGEIAGLLAEAEAGFSVAMGDGEGLMAAVLRLRDDLELRERMGRNARRMCEERFSRRSALEKWEEALSLALFALSSDALARWRDSWLSAGCSPRGTPRFCTPSSANANRALSFYRLGG